MLTLFLWALSIVCLFPDLHDISADAQAIVLAICVASELNLISRWLNS